PLGQGSPLWPALSLLGEQSTTMQIGEHLRQPFSRQQHIVEILVVQVGTRATHQLRRAARTDLLAEIDHQPAYCRAQRAQGRAVAATNLAVESGSAEPGTVSTRYEQRARIPHNRFEQVSGRHQRLDLAG